MKKITKSLLALLLGASVSLTGGCGIVDGFLPNSSQTPPINSDTPIEEEKKALYLTSLTVDTQSKEAVFYAGEEYSFAVSFGGEEVQELDVNDVTVSLSGEGLTYSIKQKKIVVTAAAETTGKISVSATIEGTKYTSEEYAIKVVKVDRIRANTTSYFLLAKEDMQGNAVNAENTSRQISVYRFDSATGEEDITDDVTFASSNENIVTVDETGKVNSVSSGSATVTCTYGAEKVEIDVDVYVPIYTAEDMDTLALYTYYEDKDTATKLLSQNYALMNDIDYSNHERNYILPIASPAIPDIHAVISRYNAASGDCSYFSYAWKNMLGLTQKVGAQGEQYLEKADGTPFKGINPSAVKFTGVFDGNGYAIKNAWLMLDNVLYLNGVTSQNTGYLAGANCFIGYNYGILRNLAFLDFTIGSSHDQLYTVNSKTGELENKYTFFDNSMWANWKDPNNRAKMQNAMTIIYRSGTFPGTAVSEGVKYKSEILGTVDTAGYRDLQTYGGDEVPSGRTLWATRPNSASALVFINEGVVQDLYLDYFQAPNLGIGISSGTFTAQNSENGLVKDCVAIVEVRLNDARRETIFYAGSILNKGTLDNVSVAVEVYKRTDYGMVIAESNTGKVLSCASYYDKTDFMENCKTLDKYSANIWEKETMVLKNNVYGFVN